MGVRFDRREVLRAVREGYVLAWDGIHGAAHWERVRVNGLALAPLTGADTRVIELFALLHDSRRLNDGHDPGHGARGAELARELAGRAFDLEPAGLELLVAACRDHTRGLVSGDPTVLTCWDADRLDLLRVGIEPRPERLCTPPAREPSVMEWASRRALELEAEWPPALPVITPEEEPWTGG